MSQIYQMISWSAKHYVATRDVSSMHNVFSIDGFRCLLRAFWQLFKTIWYVWQLSDWWNCLEQLSKGMEGPQRRLKLEVKAETEVTPWQQSMQASPSQGSGFANPSQGGDRQDDGPTPVSRRDHLKGARSILEFAHSDQEFHVMARCMEGLCGLKIDDLGLKKPKRALHRKRCRSPQSLWWPAYYQRVLLLVPEEVIYALLCW